MAEITSTPKRVRSKGGLGVWMTHAVLLVLVVVAGGYLRFVGINWDEFQHLHPDERFLTMVATGILPVDGGWTEYFDTVNSTLNPYNQGYTFFVYGTAPIFFVRYLAEWIAESGLNPTDFGVQTPLVFGIGYDQVHLVGRAVSAFADTLSVLLLYFVGKRLYNRTIGLLSAALAAGAVATIQQAHFFTVDSVANLFVTLCMLFAVRALHSDRTANYGLFGIALGAAAASRINTAPVALLIVLVVVARTAHGSRHLESGLRLALAAVLSIVVFRVAQPYAFNGPTIFDFGFNEHWLNNLREIRGQMVGDVDFPPNHQWTDQPALIFPWRNMVLWGMGPTLGLAAWSGFAWAAWKLLRRRGGSGRHLLPVVWIAFYFIWQGMQWVKPIRYLLPIYPTLILLGAWALCEVSHVWGIKRLPRLGSMCLIAFVVITTAGYAFGFSRIYTRPVTRVEASRWIYENIPGPFSLIIETPEGNIRQPVLMPVDFQYLDGQAHTQPFTGGATGVITALEIAHLGEVNPDSGSEIFRVSILDSASGGLRSGSATLTADLSANAGHTMQLQPPLPIYKGRHYQLVSQAVVGAPLTISGSVLINESSWDDGLPLRIDGRDAFAGIYVGHNLELYWEDNENKRDRMLDILARGDYILISSNRQYGAIPRLSTRYPLTIAYYDALFSGELGFNLVKEFTSEPTVGPWKLSDQSAEEPFTVYDHPRVLIFQKAAEFAIENARDILETVDLSRVIWMNPKDATAAPTGLMLPTERASEQRAGGTWSAMFDSDSAINQRQWLGVLAWWVGLLLLGWMLFPLAFFAFCGLPDRGYAVSKIMALLLIGWLAWILASARWLPFTRGTIAVVTAILVVLAGGLALKRAGELWGWIVAHRGYVFRVELLWLGLFLLDLLIRWNNPDLWHPAYGGEKPMDFSYFNGVLRSTSFPPLDPWLSGGYINYYYFGYVIAAIPTKLLGIVPSIAYNLLLPMLFAMTGTGAFCVAYNLTRKGDKDGSSRSLPYRPALLGGLAAAALMVLLGNLGQLGVIGEGLGKVAKGASKAILPGIGVSTEWLSGLYQVLFEGKNIPMGTGEWYWNATRIIPHLDSEAVPITEFPLFTFLYGDLHAHMLAMPLTLLAVAWALSAVLGAMRSRDLSASVLHWGVGGLTIGALGPTNTWDLPTYLALGCVAVVWAQWRRHDRLMNYDMVLGASGRVALLIILAVLFFRPYSIWYGSGYNAVVFWGGSNTSLSAYLKIHGLFLFILVTFMVTETRLWIQKIRTDDLRDTGMVQGGGIMVLASFTVVSALLLFSGVKIAPLVLGLVAWALLLLLPSRQTVQKRAVLGLVILSLLLTLVVELVRLEGDVSRMNTVFKFYLQVWTMLSVASGAGLAFVWQELKEWDLRITWLWKALLGLLVTTAATYTVLASFAKMRDRMAPEAPRTLDGMAFMQFSEYHDQGQLTQLASDYDAIRWMQENVSGSPVIVEAHTSEYKYGSRYTMYTGLPAVVGWNWHQRQQRAVTSPDVVTERVEAVDRFYRGVDINAALAFLEKYDVRYIVLGDYERAYYPAEGLEKFELMLILGFLDIAYDNGDVVVYGHNTQTVD